MGRNQDGKIKKMMEFQDGGILRWENTNMAKHQNGGILYHDSGIL
jgi:hypothetical protein